MVIAFLEGWEIYEYSLDNKYRCVAQLVVKRY